MIQEGAAARGRARGTQPGWSTCRRSDQSHGGDKVHQGTPLAVWRSPRLKALMKLRDRLQQELSRLAVAAAAEAKEQNEQQVRRE